MFIQGRIWAPLGCVEEASFGSISEWGILSSTMTNRGAALVSSGLVLALSLSFDPWGWAPFGPTKWMLLGALVPVSVALIPRWSFHRLSAICWGGFLVWVGIAAFAGSDTLHAWLGTPDRRFGFLTLALIGACYLVGQQLGDPQSIRLLSRSVVIAVIGIGVYTVAEVLGRAPVDLAGVRPGGTFGNASYLGGALVLMLPVVFESIRSENSWWRWASGGGFGLGSFALVVSESRAALVGVVVAFLFIGWVHRRSLSVPWVAVGASVLVVLICFSPAGGRIREIFQSEASARGRVSEWSIALRVIGEDVVMGHGPEGYRIVFPSHVDEEYEREFGRRVTPDRAHMGALDMAAVAGIPALALYLTAGVFVLRRARVALLSRAHLRGIAVGVVGYLGQQQFLFPVFEIEPVMWLFVGLLVTTTSVSTVTWESPAWWRTVIASLCILALGAGILEVTADRLALDAYESQVPTVDADRAFDFRPDSIRYGFISAVVARRFGDLEGAIQRIDAALRLSPGDPALLAIEASLLIELAQSTGNGAQALATAKRMVEDDPNNADNRLRMGLAYYLAGDLSKAEDEFRRSAYLGPRSVVPLVNLAALYLEQGRREEAAEAVAMASSIDSEDPRVVALVQAISGVS